MVQELKEKVTILVKKNNVKKLREIKKNTGVPIGSSLENAFEKSLIKVKQ